MDLLEGSENFIPANGEEEVQQEKYVPPMKEGRYVLYKFKCPLCRGLKCKVKKKSRDGHPVLYCNKFEKWIECVYQYV